MAVTEKGYTQYQSGFDYHNAARRRLGRIHSQENQAVQHASTNSALESSRRAFDEQMQLQQAQLQSSTIGFENANSLRQYGADLLGRVNIGPGNYGAGGYNGASGGGSELERFIGAIAQKESGGNYSAVNRDSGALGRYQIMPFNIPSWSRAALGYQVTPSQFLSSPQLQEQIARHQLTQYYQRYGPAGAAVAWYAGPGSADRFVNSGYLSRGAEGKYPSQYAYVQAILNAMRG